MKYSHYNLVIIMLSLRFVIVPVQGPAGDPVSTFVCHEWLIVLDFLLQICLIVGMQWHGQCSP